MALISDRIKQVELLAPAGSMEALKAAIINGCDAVYLGGNQFGARAYANNFTNGEIIEAVKLAHLYNVKVYITVNTLIYDDEFTKVMEYIDFLYHNDVDAVIVQDIGLMGVIRNNYPDFDIHASTQMTIHNTLGAGLLKDIGVKRIVLARENTLAEIKKINELNIDTEVFVHGALCVCYSGQCLMSSLIGGRSGNRGRCAQPCRKLYDLVKNDEVLEKRKYLISPRDLNTINHLDEIIASGVASLKIEGRMKSPEYVGIVVGTYRKVIDNYYKYHKINITDSDMNNLAQIFNRGFTKGFMFMDNGLSFINKDKNNNAGVFCGIVEKVKNRQVTIRNKLPLNLQDGIYFNDANVGLTITRIYDKSESGLITIDVNEKIKVGDKVYKTRDYALEKSVNLSDYPKIPLHAEVYLHIGSEAKIKLADDLGNYVETKTDYIVQKGLKTYLSKEKITEQISKLGNTPFYLASIKVDMDEEIFIVLSALNDLRRNAVNSLKAIREKHHLRHQSKTYQYLDDSIPKIKETELIVFCRTIAQVEAAVMNNVHKVYVNDEIYNQVKDTYENIYCVTKRINHQSRKSLTDKVVISDLGLLSLIKNEQATTNVNLNVTNSESIKFLKKFSLNNVTLSPEMNDKTYKNLLYKDKSILEIIIYGYLEVMETKYCLFYDNCQKQCQKGDYWLVDEKKEKFMVNMDNTCHMHIYNSKKLIFVNEIKKLLDYGYRNFRIQFNNENFNEALSVIKAYQGLLYDNNQQLIKTIMDEHKKI